MVASGKDTEAILTFLRKIGCSKIDSIRLLIPLRDLSLAEAKQIVHFSETWKDTRQADEEFSWSAASDGRAWRG